MPLLLRSLVCTCALALFCCGTLSAQVVVKERPEAPVLKDRTPPVAKEGFLIAPDAWAVKDGRYVFQPARRVRERPGYKFVPGRWKKVKGGWTFVTERWKKR